MNIKALLVVMFAAALFSVYFGISVVPDGGIMRDRAVNATGGTVIEIYKRR